jgi:hypothetical protein
MGEKPAAAGNGHLQMANGHQAGGKMNGAAVEKKKSKKNKIQEEAAEAEAEQEADALYEEENIFLFIPNVIGAYLSGRRGGTIH